MRIKEITLFSRSEFEDIDMLMKQLSSRYGRPSCGGCADERPNGIGDPASHLSAVVADPASHLFALFDKKKIVGCATLCVFHSPSATKASIEDVVVLESYRGRHLGRMLMEHVLSEAVKYSPVEIQLTSKPARAAANALYRSLGFEQVQTNCYRLRI